MDVPTLEHLILRKLRSGGQISRRDLADQLDIARSTAGRRAESLIERGLLYESGVEERSTVGRPRRFLEFNAEFGGFMGIDFDARRAHGVVIDFAHNVIARRSIKVPANPNAKNALQTIRQLKKKLSDRAAGLTILKCGMGIPGRVNRERRIALEYPFIENWKDIDLKTEFGGDPNNPSPLDGPVGDPAVLVEEVEAADRVVVVHPPADRIHEHVAARALALRGDLDHDRGTPQLE